MKTRTVAAVLAWFITLVVAGMWGHAAGQQPPREQTILSGDDIGFRITGVTQGGLQRGTLVVRVDGKWVDVELTPKMAIRPVR
jgi:hypothetical protein